MQKALIIGCGYTGLALARRLAQNNIELHLTSRTGGKVEDFSISALDLLDEKPLALPDVHDTTVYYMVPTLFRQYDSEQLPHLRPLARVLEKCGEQRPAGFIYLSSTSVYGEQNGAVVDEQTTPRPNSPWGKMRLDLERLALAFGSTQKIPVCILRIAEIYGPGRGPIARLQRGLGPHDADRFSNRIHRDDLADILCELGKRLDRSLLIAADGNPSPTKEVYEYAARLLGLTELPPSLPLPTDPNTLSLARDSKRLNNSALLNWLGHPLRYPSYREGMGTVSSL